MSSPLLVDVADLVVQLHTATTIEDELAAVPHGLVAARVDWRY